MQNHSRNSINQGQNKNQEQNLPLQENQFSKLHKILHKLYLPISKTIFCKHKNSCLEDIIRDGTKITVVSYLIKSAISAVFSLKKLFSSPTKFFIEAVGKSSMKFGLFLGSFIIIFRSLLCICRRIIKQDLHKYIPLIAGFISSLIASIFLEKKSRQSYGLFLLARAIDISYNNLVKKGILPEFKYIYVVVYSVMMGITGYAFATEPGSMSPQMNKFYLSFTDENLRDLQMRQIMIERKNNYLQSLGKGIERQNPIDYMPKLKKYYKENNIK